MKLYKVEMMRKIGLLVTAMTAQLMGTEATSSPLLQKMTFEVSLEDLIIGENSISMTWNNQSLLVHALYKEGNGWMAIIECGRETGYCQRGHDLCGSCKLCHKEGCYYYVKPCWEK